MAVVLFFFFFQAEDGIRDYKVTGVQTCALPIYFARRRNWRDHHRRSGRVGDCQLAAPREKSLLRTELLIGPQFSCEDKELLARVAACEQCRELSECSQ